MIRRPRRNRVRAAATNASTDDTAHATPLIDAALGHGRPARHRRGGLRAARQPRRLPIPGRGDRLPAAPKRPARSGAAGGSVLGELDDPTAALWLLRELRSGDALTSRVDPVLPVIVVSPDEGEWVALRAPEARADDYVLRSASYPSSAPACGRCRAARDGGSRACRAGWARLRSTPTRRRSTSPVGGSTSPATRSTGTGSVSASSTESQPCSTRARHRRQARTARASWSNWPDPDVRRRRAPLRRVIDARCAVWHFAEDRRSRGRQA